MNSIELELKQIIKEALKNAFDLDVDNEEIVIEIPKDSSHGDYATNAAMKFAKRVGDKPQVIANTLKEFILKDDNLVAECTIAGPGFINFKIKSDTLGSIITKVLSEKENYGHNNVGEDLKINVEYVSANPTGDLHLGHARGAAWGDSVTRILKASGYDVTREYYINDGGNQIVNLGKSLQARYREYFNESFELPEDGYHGNDVKEIAIDVAKKEGRKYLDYNDGNLAYFKKVGIKFELDKIKRDLEYFRVHFDVWSSEQAIRDAGKVDAVVKKLGELGYTYELDEALWFKTTEFGDDKDRVLRKADGSYTYLVPDIAYHMDKLSRGFEKLVDLFGADHHGYIPRIKASIQALGGDADTLDVDIIQMVRLVEDGKEVKMSKRLGNAVTLRELCDEVGVDATRYFFVNRAIDTHFDFDLALAKKKNNDNPVYYVQYAHARICSVLANAEGYGNANNYELLNDEKEVQLLKHINEFTNVVSDAALTRSPNKICNYVHKLASLFHSFYGSCKVIDADNKALSDQRVDLLKACKITLANALDLIGVSAPSKM